MYFGTPPIFIHNGGCLYFGRLLSDHQGKWVDIPTELLLGFNSPPLTHPDARRLKIDNPRVVVKYNNQLHDDCMKDSLYEHWNYLHNQVVLHSQTSDNLPQYLVQEFEEVDKILEYHMINAEVECRKLHTGSVPWSPTYKKNQLDYWRIRQRYLLCIH